MNPLENYPKIRSALYLAQWVVSGVLLVATTVILILTGGEAPLWLTATTAGFNAFTTYTGLVSQSNVVESGEHDTDLADYEG